MRTRLETYGNAVIETSDECTCAFGTGYYQHEMYCGMEFVGWFEVETPSVNPFDPDEQRPDDVVALTSCMWDFSEAFK